MFPRCLHDRSLVHVMTLRGGHCLTRAVRVGAVARPPEAILLAGVGGRAVPSGHGRQRRPSREERLRSGSRADELIWRGVARRKRMEGVQGVWGHEAKRPEILEPKETKAFVLRTATATRDMRRANYPTPPALLTGISKYCK